jgi:hypothetical protein
LLGAFFEGTVGIKRRWKSSDQDTSLSCLPAHSGDL